MGYGWISFLTPIRKTFLDLLPLLFFFLFFSNKYFRIKP